jgi:hypothetical protein
MVSMLFVHIVFFMIPRHYGVASLLVTLLGFAGALLMFLVLPQNLWVKMDRGGRPLCGRGAAPGRVWG